MSRALTAAVAGLVAGAAAACGAGTTKATTPVERCTQLMLERAEQFSPQIASRRPEAERYVRTTYCERFARAGFVYDDGTLAIGAYRLILTGGTCATAQPGEPAHTVPCDELGAAGPNTLDCGILHFVRRSEVQAYLRRLTAGPAITCDDGTPLEDLGA